MRGKTLLTYLFRLAFLSTNYSVVHEDVSQTESTLLKLEVS
jgi:hypothetical protein